MNGLHDTLTTMAYLDGGSGSMAIQMLLAGVFASVYGLKNVWLKIKMGSTKKADHRASDPS